MVRYPLRVIQSLTSSKKASFDPGLFCLSGLGTGWVRSGLFITPEPSQDFPREALREVLDNEWVSFQHIWSRVTGEGQEGSPGG